MKRSIIIPIILLVLVGISADMMAQPKKHKKKKNQTADTTAAAPVASNTPPPAATPPPPAADDVDTSLNWIAASGLTADTSGLKDDMTDVVLDSSRPNDGFYHQSTLRGAKPFPIILPDKNNLKVYKRIWREIDVRDSVNRIFATPGETLIELVLDGIKNKKVIAYENPEFTKPISYEKVMSRLRDSVIIPIQDDNGNVIGSKALLNDFNPDSVTRYEMKEDIVFDKIRGRMITEIISLAPIRIKSGFDIKPFYLNFNQCRNLLAAREVIDLQRDIQNMSYDDLFIQRNFKSKITKEANPGDVKISQKFPDDAAQQKESDRMEKEIRTYKKRLWKY